MQEVQNTDPCSSRRSFHIYSFSFRAVCEHRIEHGRRQLQKLGMRFQKRTVRECKSYVSVAAASARAVKRKTVWLQSIHAKLVSLHLATLLDDCCGVKRGETIRRDSVE